MNINKVVLGTLAGLAVGALVGVLLAPEKGSATRKKFMDKGADLKKDVKNSFSEYKHDGAVSR